MALNVDFAAAAIAAPRANGACASAFGDSSTTPKFQSTQAAIAVPLPYARLLELPATSTFQSAGIDGQTSYFERGELRVDVFDTSERSARIKGQLVAGALNDAPLFFADGALLELRLGRAFFTPEPSPGPGSSVVYHRVLIFNYLIQRNL